MEKYTKNKKFNEFLDNRELSNIIKSSGFQIESIEDDYTYHLKFKKGS